MFSLAGLYLAVELGYTGREVQKAHTALGELDRDWPGLERPTEPGAITVRQVIDADPGDGRERVVDKWAESVWQAWDGSHERVRELCSESLDIDP